MAIFSIHTPKRTHILLSLVFLHFSTNVSNTYLIVYFCHCFVFVTTTHKIANQLYGCGVQRVPAKSWNIDSSCLFVLCYFGYNTTNCVIVFTWFPAGSRNCLSKGYQVHRIAFRLFHIVLLIFYLFVYFHIFSMFSCPPFWPVCFYISVYVSLFLYFYSPIYISLCSSPSLSLFLFLSLPLFLSVSLTRALYLSH